MTRHVDHLLAAYVEDQLSPTQAAQVYQHTFVCSRCRAELARREGMSRDLRLALGGAPRPHPARVQAWWQAVIAPLPHPAYHAKGGPLLIAMLAVLAVILPFYGLAGALSGETPFPAQFVRTPAVQVTAPLLASAPQIENYPEAPTLPEQTAVATLPPSSIVASAPLIPAPPAPPTP